MHTAEDLMETAPITLSVSAKVRDALRALSQTESRHVPLLDTNGKLVGMVSDRRLNELWSMPDPADETWLTQLGVALEMGLDQLVRQDVVAVVEDADVIELMELMIESKLAALPVVNSDRQLLGVVSMADVMSELSILVAGAEA